MKQNTNVNLLRIEGHTDDSGTHEHNQTLSENRAATVKKWLVDHGTAPDRLKSMGFGETKPQVPNTSAANKQQNRRTEFRVEVMDGKPVADDSSMHK